MYITISDGYFLWIFSFWYQKHTSETLNYDHAEFSCGLFPVKKVVMYMSLRRL